MNEGSDIPKRAINRPLALKAGVALGVVVLTAAILAPRSVIPPTSSPGATHLPTAAAVTSPAPGPSGEPWDDLLLEPYEPTASLTPDDVDSIGLAFDTTFTLRSLTGTPALKLAAGLRIDPPTAYTLAAGATPDLAIVRPTTPLAAGLRYRFRLETPDGALAGVWAFVARAPLHVSGTLPGNLAVDVPTNTGIEVTFDQDGTTGFEGRFSIDPAVPGRIEQHGRTWAFVSAQPLAFATIYTVTVHKGVGVAGSDETLESDLSFRFETSAEKPGVPRLGFGTSILEIRPGEKPVVALGEFDDDDKEARPSLTSIGVTIHRLPTFNAVKAAAIALSGPDSWAQVSPSAVVPTHDLQLVATVDASIARTRFAQALRIPVELARGHYIVTIVQPGPPVQLLLQVTDLSGFAQTATDTTVVWVNDLASGAGVVDATVSVVNGPSLGATGPGGLLRQSTPTELRTDVALPEPYGIDGESFHAANLLAVAATDGRHLLIPLGASTSWLYGDGEGGWGGGAGNDWWLLLHTDRTTYRQTDTVHVYGVIRARTNRSVPDGIELRLHPAEGESDTPIARVPVQATARGVFSADVRLDDLPRTSYQIDLYVGTERVSSLGIDVTVIRKPAYQIAITTDRHAYLLGEIARVTVGVDFYDGTAVPGIDLKLGGFDSAATDTTDDLGAAGATIRTTLEGSDPEGIHEAGIDVRPVNPEEGESSGSAYVFVAPSRAWLSGNGSVTGGKVVVDGTLTWTNMVAVEAAGAAGTYPDDPGGAPIAGGTVKAHVIHLVPVRREIGRYYDFIEKKVVTEYEYDIKEVSLGTKTLTAAADGQFHLSVDAPVASDGYRVVLTASDPEGRPIRKTLYAAEAYFSELHPRPYLDSVGPCYSTLRRVADLGSPVTLTMHDGDGSVADGRFLFLVTERGSVQTTIQDTATFTRTLRDADLPGFDVRAIWLTDTGYATADVQAVVNPDDKAISITLVPDRARYRPGQTATIAVTTTNANGKPIAADVVIQGVDEKLYTLGQAYDFNPRDELLAMPSSGLLQSHRSHALPNDDEGGCGSEGGGRDDFKDVVTFQRIATNAQGHGSVSFALSDDLTSWHVSAVAVSGALDSGQASVLLPVGLPFFVDATLAAEYLTGDQAVLRVRAYGESLHAGDPVSFVVSAPSLGLAPTTVEGTAFEAARVSLPAMVAGDHAIRIEGIATINGTERSDALIRTVHVIETRLGALVSNYEVLGASFAPKGGEGLTRYVITDEGRGRFISQLEELASSTSARFDSAATAEMARQLLIDEFKVPESSLPTTGFDSTGYQRYGIALLPYASEDVFLSARAALIAGSQLDTEQLRSVMSAWETTTREQAIAVLAGRAALGDDVLAELHAFDAASLSVREQLWLALGLQAVGDEAGARTIERSVLEAHGERLGPWVRLVPAASPAQSLEADGLLLLLAARLGDPIANDVSSYLVDHPSTEVIFPLEQLGFIQATLERLPRETARFAVTVAGERTEIELAGGGGYTLVLTRTQRTSLKLEPLQGKLAVATTWTSLDVALPSAGSVTVTRTITPTNNAPDNQLVRVVYTVTFNSRAIKGCYRLTDLLPSGLAPVVGSAGWDDEEHERQTNSPYEIDGQRVSWCASPSDLVHAYGYAARVVSPGTYRWEPSVIQAELYPTDGASIPATTYTIR